MPIHKRSGGFEIKYSAEEKERLSKNECPMCGLPKEKWNRRKDWTCCSMACSDKLREHVIFNWSIIRKKIIERDNRTCIMCGKQTSNLIVDHIQSIALGGDEWDESNMQSLCVTCNKVKTKRDMIQIAIERKVPIDQERLTEVAR